MKGDNRFICFLLIPSFITLFLLAFQWPVIDWITKLIYDPLMWFMWGLVVIAGLMAGGWICRKGRFRRSLAYLPLLAVGFTFLAAEFIPFTSLWLDLNFWACRSAREKIATDVFAGRLRPSLDDDAGLIRLRPGSRWLSAGGGEVEIEKFGDVTGVYFYVYRGVLRESMGFYYLSSEVIPTSPEIVSATKVAPRWFLVETE